MEKNILKVLDRIEKLYGEGSIVSGTEARQKPDVISTGSIGLDLATGVGGLARGSIVELRGWQSSGKSTIALNIIANAQKRGVRCLLVDGENSFDVKYAKALGVDVDNLLITQMDEKGAEKCYNIAEEALRSGEIGVLVFDSQTSLIPKKMIEDPIGSASMALQARMMSSSLPKFVTLGAQHNCLIIYITQYREKPGVMFGSPITPTGGNALKFYAHMVIEVSKTMEKVESIAHHNKTTCKVSKNKLAVPFKEAEFDVIFGEGIDRCKEIVDIASDKGIIKLSGSWYSYNGSKLGQGAASAAKVMKDNPELAEEIKEKILKFSPGEQKEEPMAEG